MIKNIDERIIAEGFHTGHEVDVVTIQKSDYEQLKEQAERVQELEKEKIVKLTKEEAEWLENYRDAEGYVYDLMHDLPIKYSINHDDLDLDRNMNNMLKLLTAFVKGYELEGEE